MKSEIPHPSSTARVGLWLFLRGLAAAYLFAFAALIPQVLGLLGSRGILPAHGLFSFLRGELGGSSFFGLPTLFWLGDGDGLLQAVPWIGAALSLLLFFDVAPILLLPLLWFLYLSVVNVGQSFFAFQWDGLLLEAGLLAVLAVPLRLRPRFLSLPPQPPAFALFLLRWLLFRLILLSGLVKLASGDPSWRDLSALSYHYFTQPLPTVPAWFFFHAPLLFHQACAVFVFAVELLFVWGAFGQPFLRRQAAAGIAALQLFIALTGNYAFFNWLTLALTCLLVDDACFLSLSGALRSAIVRPYKAMPLSPFRKTVLYGLGGFLLFWSLVFSLEGVGMGGLFPDFVRRGEEAVLPWRSTNFYGLFAVMTKTRGEILLEGSDDGTDWKPYRFPAKPGDVRRAPRWVAPYQPRLDWQMWFAALSTGDKTPWFRNFMVRLLQGSPDVLRLLDGNPFPDHPPRYVRALSFDYRFTSGEERKATGAWWTAEPEGWYYPTLSLEAEAPPK